MRCKQNNTRLYNVIFPFWMLILFPQMWLLILPGNFIIDSLVLIVSMFALKLDDKKQCYWRHIFKIFAFGMLADIVGAAFMMAMVMLEISTSASEWYLIIPAMLMAAVLIYIFNYFITFKRSEKPLRQKMAFIFAIATAPYTFLIPTSWMY